VLTELLRRKRNLYRQDVKEKLRRAAEARKRGKP
jgi:hypothetical protein